MKVEDWLGKENTLGIDIWKKKYRHGDETFEDWLERVSGGDATTKQLIRDKKFLFGGRILANRGLDKKGVKVTYSNCYVLPPAEDSIESIFDTARDMARTFSYGGGVGIDLSNLAPRGAKINNTAEETSGAVSFSDLYSMTTGLIGQHGRRGALMLSMSCDHPDIEEFIKAKTDVNRNTKANMSVRVSDKFMEAVETDSPFTLYYRRDETGEEIKKVVKARDLFKMLCDANYDYGEPGVLFWDRIEGYNLMSAYEPFSYAGVNPCAEEPLPAGGACLLGSLNLSAFVPEEGVFDLPALREAVGDAVRALNAVLEEGVPLHPLKIQRKTVNDYKQIGLGIMGLADALLKFGVKYGSKASIELCDKIGQAIIESAYMTSASLGADKGSFSGFNLANVDKTSFATVNHLPRTRALRNSQLLTIAPTGTLSTMLGISGGIEPLFATHFNRTTKSLGDEDKVYKVYPNIVWDYINEHGLEDDSDLPEMFVTAQNIDFHDRIAMQAVWQKHIDASISSTVNIPENFPRDKVFDIYMEAWRMGCKGITVFRDGCKRDSILTTKEEKKEETKGLSEDERKKLSDSLIRHYESLTNLVSGDPVSPPVNSAETLTHFEQAVSNIVRVVGNQSAPTKHINFEQLDHIEVDYDGNDSDLIGKKRKLVTGCGNLHVTAFFDPTTKKLREVFLNKGSTGGCQNFMVGLSRMISLCAKNGVALENIVEQLNSCGTCPSYAVRSATHHDTSKGSCCPMAVGKALVEMQEEMMGTSAPSLPPVQHGIVYCNSKKETVNPCPNCGEELTFSGGCNSCPACGWSKCD